MKLLLSLDTETVRYRHGKIHRRILKHRENLHVWQTTVETEQERVEAIGEDASSLRRFRPRTGFISNKSPVAFIL